MSEPRGTGDPDDRLQVAQAAGTFLDIGLEVVRRVLVAQMALLLLERLGLEKRAHVGGGREAAPKAIVERRRAREQAMLEKAGPNGDVLRHLALALLEGAHRVRDFETGVPEHPDEALDRRRVRIG